MSSKDRVALDLPQIGNLDVADFKPRSKPVAGSKQDIDELAARNNFTTRHAPAAPKNVAPAATGFDARSLRKSNKTAKLNIATTEDTRTRFWTLAQTMGLSSGEDALTAMMDAYQEKLDRAGE